MSNKDFDALWTFMSKYTFKMENESFNEDFLCVICNKIVIDAHQTICGCNYCHKCINEYLSGESKYCLRNKKDCKEEQIVLGVNVVRNQITNKKISNLKVQCSNEFCQYTDKLIKMEDHLRTCVNEMIECPYVIMGCDNKGGAKYKVVNHIHDDTWQHTLLLIDYIKNMKKEDLEMCKLEIASPSSEKEKKTKSNVGKSAEESKTTVLEKSLKVSLTQGERREGGEAVFSVDKFSERKRSLEAFLSPHFYNLTNNKGYKLRLRVTPGGEGDGKDTHLSVFIVICKGKNDDELSWPCEHSFEISVVNQSKGGDHSRGTLSRASVEDKYKDCFDKPIDKDNVGLGYPSFISHRALSAEGLCVNDVVVIKCTVGAPP